MNSYDFDTLDRIENKLYQQKLRGETQDPYLQGQQDALIPIYQLLGLR